MDNEIYSKGLFVCEKVGIKQEALTQSKFVELTQKSNNIGIDFLMNNKRHSKLDMNFSPIHTLTERHRKTQQDTKNKH